MTAFLVLPTPGTTIIRTSWWGTAIFAVTAFAAALGPEWLRWPAVVVALMLFATGIVSMLWAFAVAVERSRVDAIGVGGLYLGMGSSPRPVRMHLQGALTLQVAVGITTASLRPFTSLAFGTLVPIFGIGLMGMWAARHGEFEPTDPPGDTDDGDEALGSPHG